MARQIDFKVQLESAEDQDWYDVATFLRRQDAIEYARVRANGNLPKVRAFRVVRIETVTEVLPEEYLVVHRPVA